MAEQTPSLWNYASPEAYRIAQQAAMQKAATEYAQKTQQQRTDEAGYMAGAGIRQGLNSLFGVEDQGLQQVKQFQEIMRGVDRQDPNSLFAAAQKLQELGHPGADAVISVGNQVAKMKADLAKTAAETSNQVAQAGRNQADAAEKYNTMISTAEKKANRIKALKSLNIPEEQIEGIASDDKTFESYLKKAGTSITEANGRVIMIDDNTGKVIKDLGSAPDRSTTVNNIMPGEGTPKLTDILPTLTAVRAELGPAKDSISQSKQALEMLRLNNPKADAQVDRALATLAGDKQLSQVEVTSVANAGSFPQRVVDNVSKFFTGQSANLSRDEKKELLVLLNQVAVSSYNKNRNRLKTVLSTSNLSEDQVNGILDEPVTEYVPETKPANSKPAVKKGVTKSGVEYEVKTP